MEQTLVVTVTEAAVLASLMGLERWPGNHDPFAGLMAAEAEERLRKACQMLIQRGYLRVDDDAATVQPEVAAAVLACGQAPISFALTLARRGDAPTFRSLHVTADCAWEQRVGASADATCEIVRWDDHAAAFDQIVACFGFTDRVAAAPAPGALPAAALQQARELVEQRGEAASAGFLLESGLTAEVAAALAATLAQAQSNGAIVALPAAGGGPPDGQQDGQRGSAVDAPHDGLAFLAGANGLWCLRSSIRQGEPWVECIPVGAEQAATDLLAFVHGIVDRTFGRG